MRNDLEKAIKEAEEKVTPLELIEEAISCLDRLYEDFSPGIKRLPVNLHEYAGFIAVAYKQLRLLKSKLEETPGPKRIVQIAFAGNFERLYDFFTDLDLKVGDPVVCDTFRGFSVGKVAEFVETSTKADKWIVQKVDVEGHEKRNRERELKEMLE